jgi:hypothetical protein
MSRPRDGTSPRKDICIKYCYALSKVEGRTTERGRATYFRIYRRTYQMSDHPLMWIQSQTDSGEVFLKQ